MKHRLVLLALFCLPLPLTAQVSMNAVVQPADPFTPCPNYFYEVEGADIMLTSSTVNLATLVGSVVRLNGNHITDPSCPNIVFDVVSSGPPTATLRACGVARPGCTVRFKIDPEIPAANTLAFTVSGPAYGPLGDPLGTLFLSQPIFVYGTTDGAGIFDVPIPSTLLLGLTVHAQGHHFQVGPISGPGILTNPIELAFVFGPPCIDPTSCGF